MIFGMEILRDSLPAPTAKYVDSLAITSVQDYAVAREPHDAGTARYCTSIPAPDRPGGR